MTPQNAAISREPWRDPAVALAAKVHDGSMGTAHSKCDKALHSLANYVMRYERALKAAQVGELLEDTDVG